MSFSMMSRIVVVGRPLVARWLSEQDLVGYSAEEHHMPCQTKTPLSRDVCGPCKGAVKLLVGHVIAP